MNPKSHHIQIVHRMVSFTLAERAARWKEVGKQQHREEKEKQSADQGTRPTVAVVDPKCRKGPISYAVDRVEKLIVNLMYDSSSPLHYLSGNFAPVLAETPPTTTSLSEDISL